MFNGVLLLACCATVALSGGTAIDNPPEQSTNRTGTSADQRELKAEIRDIRKILGKLLVRRDEKKFIFATDTFEHGLLRPSTDPAEKLIKAALEYAYHFWMQIDFDSTGPMFDYDMGYGRIWYPARFKQRVKNFGWKDLQPACKKYHAMARALVKLLELIKTAWGRSGGELEQVQLSLANSEIYIHKTINGANLDESKHKLEEAVKMLCDRCKLDDVPPPGWPFEELTQVDGAFMLAELIGVFKRFQEKNPDPSVNLLREEVLGVVKGHIQAQASPPPSLTTTANASVWAAPLSWVYNRSWNKPSNVVEGPTQAQASPPSSQGRKD